MEFYKQHIESDIKQFNSSIKNGLNENTIQLTKEKSTFCYTEKRSRLLFAG